MRFLALALLFGCCLTGCSAFKSRERLDLAPFAERTVSLAAEIEYGITNRGEAHYLRAYRQDPYILEHAERWDQVRDLLRGVVAYSVEISTLGASRLRPEERNERFALFLDRLIRPVLEDPHPAIRYGLADLDRVLAAIREQPTFLDALRTAQPFIDELARIADLLFDATQDELAEVANYLSLRIEEENAGPIATWDALLEAQNRLFTDLGLIRRYKLTGDAAVLDELYAAEPDYPRWAADPGSPTYEELQRMTDDIVGKLRLGLDLKELLRPDLEYFANQQRELDRLVDQATLQLKKARVTIMIWARAHRNLAEGVTDPARIDIFDVTKKAVGTVL